MRIVFLGMNGIGSRVYEWLRSRNEKVVSVLTKKEELVEIQEIQPDVVISGGFRHIVPPEILSIPAMGCINMHKSLLPLNRGANPVVWTILDETPAGVSIHLMDSGIDSGPILAQREVETNFSDSAKSLYQRLEDEQFELFLDFWPQYKAGNIRPSPQESDGTYHRIADFKALRELDPDDKYTALELLNLLRAMTFPPFDNAYVELDGIRYFVRVQTYAEKSQETLEEESYLDEYGA